MKFIRYVSLFLTLVMLLSCNEKGEFPPEENPKEDPKEEIREDPEKQKEKAALLAFYDAMGGDSWVDNKNWCSDKPVSEWFGVYVDDKGYVTQIIMLGNNLTGELPDELAKLTRLEVLYLPQNSLVGAFPQVLFELRSLQYLDISYNTLSGEIPSRVSELMDLPVFFNIAANCFSGEIPSSISGHKNWKRLWPAFLGQNPDPVTRETIIADNLDIPAPEFWVDDIYGNTISSDEEYAANKLTVMFIWATLCPYSPTVVESLLNHYPKYKERGVEVIGWNTYDASLQDVESYVASKGIQWKNVYGQTLYDVVTWIPFLFVVDHSGKVVYYELVPYGSGFMEFLDEYLAKEGGEFYESTDYSKNGEVVQLQSATKGEGIDIVLMGDAYTDRMIEDGTYREVMENACELMFTEEPYASCREYFNVYMVNVVSPNETFSGRTALDGEFGEGTYAGGNNNTVAAYAMLALDNDYSRLEKSLMVVVMNSKRYAGTCHMYYPEGGDYGNGMTVSYCPTGADEEGFRRVLNHEVNGHGFAKLEDEYFYDYSGAITAEAIAARRELESYGWWKNTDITDDVNIVKWAHFLQDERYQNEGLGVFEGAGTYQSGVWRSSQTSIMRDNTGGFNAPSREAIYIRIHKLAYGEDWEYDYEAFVEYDAINRHTSPAACRSEAEMSIFRPTAPPVLIRKTAREALGELRDVKSVDNSGSFVSKMQSGKKF